MDATELVLQRGSRESVQRTERFVHQQDRRLDRKGSGKGNALAHATRQLRRFLDNAAADRPTTIAMPSVQFLLRRRLQGREKTWSTPR
jgi:hypothetical protein